MKKGLFTSSVLKLRMQGAGFSATASLVEHPGFGSRTHGLRVAVPGLLSAGSVLWHATGAAAPRKGDLRRETLIPMVPARDLSLGRLTFKGSQT